MAGYDWREGLKAHRWFCAVLLFAFVLRCWGIADRWLDWDEAFMLSLARLPMPVLIKTISIIDIHPPGAHLLLHGWVGLFGQSDRSARGFAAFFGMLGIVGTYLLALKVSGCKKIAVFTALLTVVSPFVMGFSRMVTIHGVFYTLSVWSWVLLFFWKEKQSWQRVVLYALVTFWLLYTETTAPVVLMSQAVWAGFQWQALLPPLRKTMMVLAVFFTVVYLPWLWLVSQPWHASHMPEIVQVHRAAGIEALLMAPANLLLRGSDGWFLLVPPGLDDLLMFGLPGTLMLLAAGYFIWKQKPALRLTVFCMGLLPVVLLFIIALFTGRHVFQYRAMIFAVSGLNLMLAVAIAEAPSFDKWWLRAVAVVLILGMQTLGWQLEAARHTRFLETMRDVRAQFRPGDGLMVYPGWMHIGVMRYVDPAHDGFTENELHLDPQRGNLFHMVNRIDDGHFFVSGDDVLKRPDVQQALGVFMEAHRRMWVLGMPEVFEPVFRCDRVYMVLGPDGRYRSVSCPQ